MGTQKVLIWYNGNKVTAELSDDNTKIYDSYRFRSPKDMKAILSEPGKHGGYYMAINTMLNNDMLREWRAHNFLYALHLFRSHTKDVDLNTGKPWYITTLYAIFSVLYSLVPS